MELNKIYNEDCLQTMSKIEENSIDLVLTSPPYNISRAKKNREYGLKECNVKYKDYADNLTNDEYREWTTKIFNQFDRILKKDGVVLYNISYGTEQIEKAELMWFVITDILSKTPFTVADCIVWKKRYALPLNASPNHLTRICEFVFVFVRKSDYYTFYRNHEVVSKSGKGQSWYNIFYNFLEAPNNDGVCKTHNATYSTTLCAKLLNIYGKRGGVCYDPFMGTGTTAIAAHRHKMQFIGSEISAEYCEYANKRIRNELKQLSLF